MVTGKAKCPVAQDLGRKTYIVGATSCGTGYRSDPVPPNNVSAVCDKIYSQLEDPDIKSFQTLG